MKMIKLIRMIITKHSQRALAGDEHRKERAEYEGSVMMSTRAKIITLVTTKT